MPNIGRYFGLTNCVILTNELARISRTRTSRSRKNSVMEIPEILPIGVGKNATSPPSDDDNKKLKIRWKGSGNITTSQTSKHALSMLKQASSASNVNKIATDRVPLQLPMLDPNLGFHLKLGPGQIHPKGYRLNSGRYGELKMGFLKIKGTVEVEVICARNIVPVDCETPPDTYVKCYIKDGERLRHKKKTRVIRHSAEPFYKQTIKYQSSDVFGRNIIIMVWQRCVGFEHNQGLGGTEVNLDKVNLAHHIGGWYPLFPMHSYGGSDSENSP